MIHPLGYVALIFNAFLTGDTKLEPQQREPESLTSDNDEDVGWPVFSDSE